MKDWLLTGADVSEIKTANFKQALLTLIAQTSQRYIFIEEPFGKERKEIGKFIDLVVLLDVPMEICLSRIVRRSINNPLADSLTALPHYLANYEDYFRDCYLAAVHQVRENCDLCLPFTESVHKTTHIITTWLKRLG